MADDFYDDDDPFFLVEDRLDAGEPPKKVLAWAQGRLKRAHDEVTRDQWREAIRYIQEEFPD